jgi:thiosulfate reductase cytochrome b subunit
METTVSPNTGVEPTFLPDVPTASAAPCEPIVLAAPATLADKPSVEMFYRHRLPTRIWHWLNALAVFILLGSGLNILAAHPALYWGAAGNVHDQPWLSISSQNSPSGVQGQLRVGGRAFNTTGLIGASQGSARVFPSWAMIPSYRDLATARRWHFFFAWVFVLSGAFYVISCAITRHIQRNLLPSRAELHPRSIAHDVWLHMRLKFPTGESAKRYHILQKLAYLSVLAGLLPLMLLTGLSMSPGFGAIAPSVIDFFGGRQSARSLHFIAASGLVGFIGIHLVMVLLAGPWNEIRSMVSGRFAIKPDADT